MSRNWSKYTDLDFGKGAQLMKLGSGVDIEEVMISERGLWIRLSWSGEFNDNSPML